MGRGKESVAVLCVPTARYWRQKNYPKPGDNASEQSPREVHEVRGMHAWKSVKIITCKKLQVFLRIYVSLADLLKPISSCSARRNGIANQSRLTTSSPFAGLAGSVVAGETIRFRGTYKGQFATQDQLNVNRNALQFSKRSSSRDFLNRNEEAKTRWGKYDERKDATVRRKEKLDKRGRERERERAERGQADTDCPYCTR